MPEFLAFLADAWSWIVLVLIGLVVLTAVILFVFSGAIFESAGDKGLARVFRRSRK